MNLSDIERVIEEQGIHAGDIVEMDIHCHNSTFPDYRFRRVAYLLSFHYKKNLQPGEKPDILFHVDTRKEASGFGRDGNCGDNNCGSPYSAEKDILDLRKIARKTDVVL